MDDKEPIGLLIGAVRRRIKQAVGTHVRDFSLTTQQFWILVAVAEHPGCSLRELAEHLRMDEPTASRLIATLMRRKLVQIKGDKDDRRRARIHLRASGEALAAKLSDVATSMRAAVTEGLTVEEQQVLRVALRKIIANMDRVHASAIERRPSRKQK
ncbi:MAG: winged helix-turn-helix transcriptional regulator [Deltaproteobacteria bacterium]|nr:winged helix-turn-helix transcriptional regulator [Deltaproteobacteria bacterium]